jgi:penicillin-insensitive murein endopeptidase
LVVVAPACATAPERAPEPLEVVLDTSTVEVAWKAPPSRVEVDDAVVRAHAAVGDSFLGAEERVVGWRTLPAERPWTEILARTGVESMHLSLGTTGSGTLQHAAQLPAEGDGHAIIERHRNHGTSYGTPELVDAISRAGSMVAKRYPGAVLRVGNLSRRNGGDIIWSNSHNSGRDADLAFYVHLADSGKVVPAPDLMHFDANGVAREDANYVFDVERNWALVRALLENKSINIQWLFVSIPLKQMLLDHARTLGEPEDVIARASEVMHQPTDALPHDDHFHLRIGCSKEDRLEGCIDWGPKWEWADWHDDALKARSLEVARVFQQETSPETRLEALAFLETIKSPYRAEVALIWGVWYTDETVRTEALSIADRAWPWSTAAIVAAQRFIVDDRSTLSEKAEAYSILRRAQDPVGWAFAKDRIRADDVEAAEKVYAARALEHAMDADLVPFLLTQLIQQPGPVRAELASVLMRVTNHEVACNWASGSDAEIAKAVDDWEQWWVANRAAPRDAWVLAGFRNLGVELEPDLGPHAVDKLLPLLREAPEHVIYNVNRLVREVTGRWAPLEQVNGAKLYQYWIRWWRKNRSRLLAES